MKIEVIHVILPLHFLQNGQSGFPSADYFQDMFEVYVDGKLIFGMSDKAGLQNYAEALGIEGKLPEPTSPVFDGW
jgi:hypothetical protein